MSTNNLLSQLSQAVSFSFPDDPTRPGIVISSLKDGQVYASVVRYGAKFVKGKQVVCSVYADSLDSAVTKLGESFLIKVQAPTNPIDVLRNSLKK